MTDEPIRLAEYDDTWPARFQDEVAVLAPVLAPWLTGPIVHIGSTAIPGLVAKPIIDIMAGVANLAAAAAAIPAVAAVGYEYFPYRRTVMHWFCKPSPVRRTHHLHLVPTGSSLWHDRLSFRDYLRAHPTASAEYGQLKAALAVRYRDDREAYTEGKSEFVTNILKRAAASS